MLAGLRPSVGTVADALDNALCETTLGLYKTECIRAGSPFRTGPIRSLTDLEGITSTWISWYNQRRLMHRLGRRPPAEVEAEYYARLASEHTVACLSRLRRQSLVRSGRLRLVAELLIATRTMIPDCRCWYGSRSPVVTCCFGPRDVATRQNVVLLPSQPRRVGPAPWRHDRRDLRPGPRQSLPACVHAGLQLGCQALQAYPQASGTLINRAARRPACLRCDGRLVGVVRIDRFIPAVDMWLVRL
jgi:hypothetical protein